MSIIERESEQQSFDNTNLAGRMEAKSEIPKYQEVIQITFDEFLQLVEQHTKQCTDTECHFDSETKQDYINAEKEHTWNEAALHMLSQARIFPSSAFHLDKPTPDLEKWLKKHPADSKRPPASPRYKVQIFIPEEELDRPWAQAYLRGHDMANIMDIFYPYTDKQGEDPEQLRKDALDYIEREAPLMNALAHIRI